MDKKTILHNLNHMREINFMGWERMRDFVKERPSELWRRNFRDTYEMEVRTLDYVMEAIKRNDFV